jgi:hypothetical protein
MGVVENLKDVAELVKKAGEIELYKQISAAEDEVREIAREKRRLEDRVQELEHALLFKDETEFKAPFYYLKQGDQTPYCPRCWEKDRHAIHVVFIFDNRERTRWDCPACKEIYLIEKPGATRQHQIQPRIRRYT